MEVPNHNKTKKKNQTPEGKFRRDLELCTKRKNLSTAISLYKFSCSNKIHLNSYHFNALLYICSEALSHNSDESISAIDFGFRVFEEMISKEINPTEATITSMARLAAAKNDGDFAFELIKSMDKYGVSPRLRSYNPILICYGLNLDVDKAYEVEKHMVLKGIELEEAEIAALLKVSAETGREERVYEYLHKMREKVRGVSESTAEIVERWFGGEVAAGLGDERGNDGLVREAVARNGGGWHGLGWLGKGKWVVKRTKVDENGVCLCCSEQLACVDIDTAETEIFAQSVAALAMEREAQSNFKAFQDWLKKHSDYAAIVDGANIGLYQQNFADGGFSLSQLETVVNELHLLNNKWPLVVLHNKRVRALFQNASNRELLEKWLSEGVLYGTPHGSNDDWYWLFAAVKLKCLMVTNDEMRDHIFELLGSSFFRKWKERHQARYTFTRGSLNLQMPPAYSLVIQESEKGTWHLPISAETTDESSRIWLCITRKTSNGDVVLRNLSENIELLNKNQMSIKSFESQRVWEKKIPCDRSDTSQVCDNNKASCVSGKRKERSL